MSFGSSILASFNEVLKSASIWIHLIFGLEGEDIIKKIPEDILVEKIFMILPASSVMAVRGVCKPWRSLTTAPSFIQAHTRHHCHDPTTADSKSLITPSNPSRYCELSPYLLLCRYDTNINQIHKHGVHKRRVEILVPPNCNDEIGTDGFRIIACCDGLLCFESRQSKSYHICNPVTKTWTTVAALSPNHCNRNPTLIGFYFHSATKEYRLLQHFITGNPIGDPFGVYGFGYEVATVNGPQWRIVFKQTTLEGGGIIQLMERMDELESLVRTVAVRDFYHPIVVTTNGNLHWLGHTIDKPKNIIVFNTDIEEFEEMAIPPECRLVDMENQTPRLNEIGGNLCISLYGVSNGALEMEIWQLRDYNLQQWTKIHVVETELGSIKTLPERETKEVRILMRWCGKFSPYDCIQNIRLCLDSQLLERTCYAYTESLVML